MEDYLMQMSNSIIGSVVYDIIRWIVPIVLLWFAKFKEKWSWSVACTLALVVFTCLLVIPSYLKSNTISANYTAILNFLQINQCTPQKADMVPDDATWAINATCKSKKMKFLDSKAKPNTIRLSVGNFFSESDLSFLHQLQPEEAEALQLKIKIEIAKMGVQFAWLGRGASGAGIPFQELFIFVDEIAINNRLDTQELAGKLFRLENASSLVFNMIALQRYEAKAKHS